MQLAVVPALRSPSRCLRSSGATLVPLVASLPKLRAQWGRVMIWCEALNYYFASLLAADYEF